MMTLSDSCRDTLCLVPSRLWYGEEAPHSCLVAPVEVGMGEENKESTGTWKHTIKELTVPKDETTGKFAKCKMYQVNFTQVVGGNLSGPDPTWPNTTCINGWTYDFSLYYSTITSQVITVECRLSCR
ncbi:hypothetical protein Pcinc_003046 [Petrolisthes cinctipes]|uniref:Uncharacterized protein n=1 Tax=Petrolisthes cinctipes TaxID=88211 RepID=A0AAE1GK43_PETCI|nr:hypothetical protein Pcinc_025237 [Petrolisthes cinctipes]KAK3893119.1 hypothetical protein Pcinc_003046 [Petrolisthes cinctipes]